AQMEARLQQTHLTPRTAWDLARGGLDARLHPQLVRHRSGWRRPSAIGRAALILAVGLGGFVAVSIAGRSRLEAAGAAIAFAVGILLLSRRPRRQRRRRSRDCDDDHDAGAGVPARPRPGAP